jgi:hypothetical protein
VTERVTRKTVSFRHPFVLAGVEGEHPAGTYVVETTEEPVGGLSFIAYRRVSWPRGSLAQHRGKS